MILSGYKKFMFTSFSLVGIATLAMAFVCSPAFAAVTVDRAYSLGDATTPALEGGSGGPTDGKIVQTDFSNLDVDILDTLDAVGVNVLTQTGDPVYRAGAPSAAGTWGIEFNGTSQQASAISPLGTYVVLNNVLDNQAAQGVRMWVKPNSNSADQVIFFNDSGLGGPAIRADGTWSQSSAGHGLGDVNGAVLENADLGQWQHVMQHVYKAGDAGAPTLSTGSASDYYSVLYVNGIAVSAHGDSEASFSDAASGTLTLANNATGDSFFDGVIDQIEQYTGAFDLHVDNPIIADQIAAIPNGGTLKDGDVNMDGIVDSGDVTAFVAGWLKEKKFATSHNGDLFVGDLQTWGWGDLDQDGRVDLSDAYKLHQALAAAGAGAGASAGLPIPEPSSLVLIAFGMMSLLGTRRRR